MLNVPLIELAEDLAHDLMALQGLHHHSVLKVTQFHRPLLSVLLLGHSCLSDALHRLKLLGLRLALTVKRAHDARGGINLGLNAGGGDGKESHASRV